MASFGDDHGNHLDQLNPGVELPDNYTSPSWPSLYNPTHLAGVYMYHASDILRFSVLWSVVLFTAVYGLAGVWCSAVFCRRTRLALLLPVVFLAVAGLIGTLLGSAFGLIIAVVYNAGAFSMSTWTPFLWSLIQIFFTLIAAQSSLSTYL